MKDTNEVLKLALEALETIAKLTGARWALEQGYAGHLEAITACEQALAQPAPVEPDWKAEYLKSVESGCITLDELRETLAELEATNRQVEILSDALAESRRELAALKSVQEPMAWGKPTDEMVQAATDEYDEWSVDNKGTTECIRAMLVKALKATPPAAQRQWVSLTHEEVMDSWDEIRDGDWAPDFYEVIEAKLKEKTT
jgi:hypothetical protein